MTVAEAFPQASSKVQDAVRGYKAAGSATWLDAMTAIKASSRHPSAAPRDATSEPPAADRPGIGGSTSWRPVRDSNPCYRRERAVETPATPGVFIQHIVFAGN